MVLKQAAVKGQINTFGVKGDKKREATSSSFTNASLLEKKKTQQTCHRARKDTDTDFDDYEEELLPDSHNNGVNDSEETGNVLILLQFISPRNSL